ncbi:MAG: hypothetical protein HN731_04110 [Rhodospirillaceae bacterium]|jgi:hypothetical protein|nr:hypothetical protein [Rhodospirillaceae bacterium]MBT4588321.1 hypothetical protein [Rhodospirillaceae bacterium]MBT5941062.1 hypothetical protein [Rhodospirillaceae bacterium]MBT7954347.1 hypothetical protein [Rhodospirillaceae bacterium]
MSNPTDTFELDCSVPSFHQERQATSYTGCDIPHDPELVAQGWQFRCNTDHSRLDDVVDTYQELGFEVHLEAVDLSGLSSDCGGCSTMLEAFSAVYTKK